MNEGRQIFGSVSFRLKNDTESNKEKFKVLVSKGIELHYDGDEGAYF